MKYDPVELIRSDDETGDLIVHVCMYVCMYVSTYEYENIWSRNPVSHGNADKGLLGETCRHADWKIGANLSEELSSSIFRVIQDE